MYDEVWRYTMRTIESFERTLSLVPQTARAPTYHNAVSTPPPSSTKRQAKRLLPPVELCRDSTFEQDATGVESLGTIAPVDEEAACVSVRDVHRRIVDQS